MVYICRSVLTSSNVEVYKIDMIGIEVFSSREIGDMEAMRRSLDQNFHFWDENESGIDICLPCNIILNAQT